MEAPWRPEFGSVGYTAERSVPRREPDAEQVGVQWMFIDQLTE